MSPEQAKGKDADHSTDVWAFGCVLYEMLTGRAVFEGETLGEVLGAVFKSEPDWSRLPAEVPQSLRRLLRRCLQKDRHRRLRSIGDAILELEEQDSAVPDSAPKRSRRARVAWLSLGLLTLFSAMVPAIYVRVPPDAANQVRFLIPTSPTGNPNNVSVSPDGSWISYTGSDSGTVRIFLRATDAITARALSGTEGAVGYFWSPDSRLIGFFAGGILKTIDVSQGTVQELSEFQTPARGGTWGADGTILFSAGGSIYRTSAAGGDPQRLLSAESSVRYSFPYFLPDGRRFLYLVRGDTEPAEGQIYVADLGSTTPIRLLAADSRAVYAKSGHLIFHRQGTLMAQEFDADSVTLTGDAVVLAENVSFNPNDGNAGFAVSDNGVLAYRVGGPATISAFTWFDRTGRQLGLVGSPDAYLTGFDLSPDQKQLAVGKIEPRTGNRDIWLLDLTRQGIQTRLTFDPSVEEDMVWSPDSSSIAFCSRRPAISDIFQKNASGVGEETLLVNSPEEDYVEDWSRDGRYIAFLNQNGRSINVLPLFGDKRPFTFIESPFFKDEPHFSFDGKWMAYGSAESGTWEVYVTSFPQGDQKRLISVGGGGTPRWRQDGRELYYLGPDGRLMAVDIRIDGNRIDSGIPRVLFDTGLMPNPIWDHYAVTPDGQRFLLQIPTETEVPPITAVINWQRSLTR
jgi:Tol biopolymer transport system component